MSISQGTRQLRRHSALKRCWPTVIVGASGILLLALVIWNLWVDHFQSVASGPADSKCCLQLLSIYEDARTSSSQQQSYAGLLPRLKELMSTYRCPNGCDYEWVAGKLQYNGKRALICCRCHLAPSTGWHFSRPAAIVLLLEGGTVVLTDVKSCTAETIEPVGSEISAIHFLTATPHRVAP
jgi:hypothetical protein